MTLINRAAQRAIDQAAQGADDTLSIDYSASRTLRKLHNSDAFVKSVRGPIGCMHPKTLVFTENGLLPISSLVLPVRVLSWDASKGRYCYSQSGGAFPKGRDYLYRVIMPQGEFVAAGHHLVLDEHGSYRLVRDLRRGDRLLQPGPPPTDSSGVPDRQEYLEGGPHSRSILSDYMGRCAALARRYGQLLLRASGVGPTSPPSPDDALRSLDNDSDPADERADAQGELLRQRTHRGLSGDHRDTGDSMVQLQLPFDEPEDHISQSDDGRNDPIIPAPELSPENFADRRTSSQAVDNKRPDLDQPDQPEPCDVLTENDDPTQHCLPEGTILQVVREEVSEEYWDMQVCDTHNYVTADGCVHHNSGKSVGCIMELMRLGLAQRPNKAGLRKSKWALVRSTYPELKSTTIKTFQEWIPDALCPVKMNDSPITARMALPLGDGTIAVIEFVFIALDKPKDLGKLLSLDLTGAFLNEAKELDKAVLDTVTSRVGRYPPIKKDGGPTWCGVIMDTNSPSEDSWYAELEQNPPDDWLFLKQPPALLRDSRHPSGFVPNKKAENISNLPGGHKYYFRSIAGKDANWVRAYVLNEFAAVRDGKPVYADTFNERVHVSQLPLWPVKDEPIYMGIDYGLTPAAVFGQLINGQLRILDELVATRLGLENFINDAINPLIAKKYANHKIEFVGDPSGSSAKDTDERSCFSIMHDNNMPVIPASSNAIEPRLGAVRHFLTRMCGKGEPAFLLDPSCKVLKNGFINGYQFVRVQVAGEARFREKPDKNSYSHPHDACQYLCLRVLIAIKRGKRNQEAEGYRAVPVADTTTGY